MATNAATTNGTTMGWATRNPATTTTSAAQESSKGLLLLSSALPAMTIAPRPKMMLPSDHAEGLSPRNAAASSRRPRQGRLASPMTYGQGQPSAAKS
ncbi:MAG: hypothetical protein SGJ20_16520 [Planctomycetota bacterium]|nr:hypothetical protein [Planctomycetota bacterium]